MKNFALVLFLIFLNSCGTTYDSLIYTKLVDISIATRKTETICTANGFDLKELKSLKDAAVYVSVYESGVPNSKDVQIILNKLLDDVERFETLVTHNNNFSQTYCEDKIQNIHALTQTALQTEGSLSK